MGVTSSHTSKTLVGAGGFAEITKMQCTDAQMDRTLLQENHEEADTRLILHAIHTNAGILPGNPSAFLFFPSGTINLCRESLALIPCFNRL